MCIAQCVIKCVFSKLMQDVYDNIPLINVCRGGHVETASLRVLLDHGAATDYRNKVKSCNAH